MGEPSLFGIGKAEWELINSFSNWLSAAGTIAAVVVSLYLASRSSRPRAELSVEHRLLIQTGQKGPPPELLLFHFVNTGDRPIRVTQLGWKTGLWQKRFAVQMFDVQQSSPLPVDLSHGQEANWYVPLAYSDDPWPLMFARKMLLPHPKLRCATLRGQVYTSLGHVFVAKPSSHLVSLLREACREVQKSGV